MSLQRLEIEFGETEREATVVTDTEVTTLVSAIALGVTKDNGVSLLSGNIRTADGRISESNEFILRQEGVNVIADKVQETYKIRLSIPNIYEGEVSQLIIENSTTGERVSVGSMHITFDHAITKDTIMVTDSEIRDSITMDGKGIITSDEPTKNVSWIDVITISAYPAMMDSPEYTDQQRAERTVSTVLTVRAIEVSEIYITENQTIYKPGEDGYSFSASVGPDNNTKTKYSSISLVEWSCRYGEFKTGLYKAPTDKPEDYIYCSITFMGSKFTNELNPLTIYIAVPVLSDTQNPLVWDAVKTALGLDASVTEYTAQECALITNDQFMDILYRMSYISQAFSFEVGKFFTGVTSYSYTGTDRTVYYRYICPSYCTDFRLPNLSSLYFKIGWYDKEGYGFFNKSSHLTNIDLPNLRDIKIDGSFTYFIFCCNHLLNVNLPNLVTVSSSNRSFIVDNIALKKIQLPKMTSAIKMTGNTALESVDLSSITSLTDGLQGFLSGSAIKKLDLPSLKTIYVKIEGRYDLTLNERFFSGLSRLEEINMPVLESISMYLHSFNGSTSLTNGIFHSCSALKNISLGISSLRLTLSPLSLFYNNINLCLDTKILDMSQTSLYSIEYGTDSGIPPAYYGYFEHCDNVLVWRLPNSLNTVTTITQLFKNSSIRIVDVRKCIDQITTYGQLFYDYEDRLLFARFNNQLPKPVTSFTGKYPVFVPKATWSRYNVATTFSSIYNSEGYALLRDKFTDGELCTWERGGETEYADKEEGSYFVWEDGSLHDDPEYYCLSGSTTRKVVVPRMNYIYTDIIVSDDNIALTENGLYTRLENDGNYKTYDTRLILEYISDIYFVLKNTEGKYLKTTDGIDSAGCGADFLGSSISDASVLVFRDKEILLVDTLNKPEGYQRHLCCRGLVSILTFSNVGVKHLEAITVSPMQGKGATIITQSMINQSKINLNRLFPDDMMDWMCPSIFGKTKQEMVDEGGFENLTDELEDIDGNYLYNLVNK